jgi:hypothetical protein
VATDSLELVEMATCKARVSSRFGHLVGDFGLLLASERVPLARFVEKVMTQVVS